MADPIDARGLMTDRGVGRYIIAAAAVIGIAIHHSVSGGTFFMSSAPDQDDELSHLLMIDQYHASLGWGGFGYHLAAFPSGRLYICGNLNGARAHVASRNDELIGLVLIGTFTDAPPPWPQLAAGAHGVAFIRRTYPARPIGPHREWALPAFATSCPGDTWAAWLPALLAPGEEEDDMTPDQAKQLEDVHKVLFDTLLWGPFQVPRWAWMVQRLAEVWTLHEVWFGWRTGPEGAPTDGKYAFEHARNELLYRARDEALL